MTNASRNRVGLDLFLISLLILFLELACIRWFPAHVTFLTFFTNTMLLACFLGMSVGCLAASRPTRLLAWTPVLLLFGLAAAKAMEYLSEHRQLRRYVDVGNQATPQVVFFGTEQPQADLAANILIPIELLAGFFFAIVALMMIGPGQELGRAFSQMPNRVRAYTINICGSLVGIVLFAGFSWLELTPVWWFLPVVVGIAYFLFPGRAPGDRQVGWAMQVAVLAGALFVPTLRYHTTGTDELWSPYYRIAFNHNVGSGAIAVNMIGHQVMFSTADPYPAYALPYLLNRDSGGPAIKDVLIIGAGSGNDVSRALQWGAEHVDAVEIDPVIQRIGAAHHPNRPYQDPRVTIHLDDGRNFLRATDRKYDLVIYALVDSLVLHSSYSNLRLESYLFTEQAFQDVKRCLKPGGLFMMYNYFRQGWLLARLYQELEQVFGAEPLLLTLPYQAVVKDQSDGSIALFVAGDTARLRKAFAEHAAYWVPAHEALSPQTTGNGFLIDPTKSPEGSFHHFGLAQVERPDPPLRGATDDWPFLYVKKPMVPDQSLRGGALMGSIALLMIYLFLPRGSGRASPWGFNGQMFFLGAAFMLIETKAVVHLALLFGSTWMVNSVVFFAVLVMILAANLFVLGLRPARLWPYYAGLLAALAVNSLVPLDFFLGMERTVQVLGSCLLVFTPIFFAGVVFATSFARSPAPDLALGANIAGAMAGGLLEYTSMLLGFQHLVLVAMGLYLLSAVCWSVRPLPVLADA